MCDVLSRLTHGFTYESDDADGRVYYGNDNYERYKDAVLHIASCGVCQSEGWRSFIEPRDDSSQDGKLWYGDTKSDERVAIQHTLLVGSPEPSSGISVAGGTGTAKTRSPNDQRSDVLNPNSKEYRAAMDNRKNQLNPNNSAYRRSRGKR